jgi:hypothetical protein
MMPSLSGCGHMENVYLLIERACLYTVRGVLLAQRAWLKSELEYLEQRILTLE